MKPKLQMSMPCVGGVRHHKAPDKVMPRAAEIEANGRPYKNRLLFAPTAIYTSYPYR